MSTRQVEDDINMTSIGHVATPGCAMLQSILAFLGADLHQ
jgi:hypothetical protein